MAKRQVWYAVGVVTDKLIRDLRELQRMKKIQSAGQDALEGFAPTGVGALAKDGGDGTTVDNNRPHLDPAEPGSVTRTIGGIDRNK
jgi:hypothetical protein